MKIVVKTGIMLLLTAALLLPLAGCNGDKEEPVEETAEPNRWLELLRIMPDNGATLNAAFLQSAEYADILRPWMEESAREAGIEEKLTDTMLAHFVHNPLPLFMKTSYTDAEWKETVGFTVGNVTESIVALDMPQNEYQAVRGNFSTEDIEYAAKNGPLQEHLEIKSYEGYEYYSWGEDREINLDWRSNIRNLGRGHRLAYVDGFALWVVWTEGLEEMIDAYKGNIPSLADREDYRMLASKLVEMDTVNACFSAQPVSIVEFNEMFAENLKEIQQEQPEQTEAFENEQLLEPFIAFAAGAGENERGSYLAIVILNEDEETAKENASLLQWRINESIMVPYTTNPDMNFKKWTDNDAIESMEIGHDGRFTTAKLYGRVFVNWKSLANASRALYHPLLLHE